MNLNAIKIYVEGLYQFHGAGASEFVQSGWAYHNHVKVVARISTNLAQRFGGDPDISCAGALLHDVADTVMARNEVGHNTKSLEMAVQILIEVGGLSPAKAQYIVDEVIKPHSCRQNNFPTEIEGKILATADAVAHLEHGFYMHFMWNHYGRESYGEFRDWAMPKIKRDYRNKIFFQEVREEMLPYYNALKLLIASNPE